MIIRQDIALQVIKKALSTGGDFAEIFLQDKSSNNLGMIDGAIETAVSGRSYGAGVRIFFGEQGIYVYTNDISLKGLMEAASQAAAAIDGKPSQKDVVLNLTKLNNNHPIEINPLTVPTDKKAKLIVDAYNAVKSYDSLIKQAKTGYMDTVTNIQIVNSEGLFVEDSATRTRMYISAVASDGKENQTGVQNPGGHMGFEFYKDKIDTEGLAKQAAKQAVTMLKADYCPAGKMTVAIDNGFGGVIFHEACGHSLEATSVAQNRSVFCGKMGQQIASPVVTAIDDGTIPNAWGSRNIDDEGNPTQKNVLIEKGILKSYLVDKLNGRRMNAQPNGASRRESYAYAPTSRMSNTYIDNGESTKEEIIKSIDDGLYAASMGGGSVNPVTGEFNFVVTEGYLVKNGQIDKPVRGASLIGKGSDVLMNIDMVADNLEFGQGMCGSISGSIPADVGQPTIRVSEILVGGK